MPGTVDGNPVFVYHDEFNDDRAEVAGLKRRYLAGTVGDVEVKDRLAVAVNRFLDPMRERRARFEASSGLVEDLIVTGTQQARRQVQQTVADMRRAMGLAAVFSQLRDKARRTSGADGI